MEYSSTRAVVGPTIVGVPYGTLQIRDGRLCLRLDRKRSHANARPLLERLRRLDLSMFTVPERIDDLEHELVAIFPRETPGTISLRQAWPTWRRSMPKFFPLIFSLVRFLVRAAQALEQAGLSKQVVFAPVQVRYCPNRPGLWSLSLFPTCTSNLEELAGADEDLWSWTSGAFILGASDPSPTNYSIAAAFYSSVVGDPFPGGMSANERFRSVLRGCYASEARLRAVASGSLPKSFNHEVEELIDFIMAPLSPDVDQRPSRQDWRARLAKLSEMLSPVRIAVRWEHEGSEEIAHALLEQVAVSSVDQQDLPWGTISRLRLGEGDIEGAIDAHAQELRSEGVGAVGSHISLFRRLAALQPAASRTDVLSRMIDDLDASGVEVRSSHRLHVADLEAQTLRRIESALQRLAKRTETDWEEIVRAVMRGRLLLYQGKYVSVCQEVRGGLERITRLPGARSAVCQYAAGYLHYLGGVANFGGIGVLNDPSYLGDSFSSFANGFTSLIDAEGCEELRLSVIRWIRWIERCADQFGAQQQYVKAGATAFLGIHGLSAYSYDLDASGPPRAIWYEIELLLPLMERL